MQNFFQLFMYMVFGKRWILWDMVQGFKMAIFVNEVEITMQKGKIRDAQERKEQLERDLAELEARPLSDPMDFLPAGEVSDKVVYDMKKKIEGERAEQIVAFKNQIKSAEQDAELADGELQKIYAITYTNRRKYDYVKNYQIKSTYADLNK